MKRKEGIRLLESFVRHRKGQGSPGSIEPSEEVLGEIWTLIEFGLARDAFGTGSWELLEQDSEPGGKGLLDRILLEIYQQLVKSESRGDPDAPSNLAREVKSWLGL